MMTVDFNSAAFSVDIRRYAATRKMTLKDAINHKMLFVARGAWKATPVAGKPEITRSLTSPARINPRIRVADAIVISRRRAGGKSIDDFRTSANSLIRKRISHVGALKAGWIRAIKIISAAVKGEAFVEPTKVKVKNPGEGIPASASQNENPFAKITYNLAVKMAGGEGKRIDPRVVRALKSSFNREAASTESYLLKKLSS